MPGEKGYFVAVVDLDYVRGGTVNELAVILVELSEAMKRYETRDVCISEKTDKVVAVAAEVSGGSGPLNEVEFGVFKKTTQEELKKTRDGKMIVLSGGELSELVDE